MMFYTEENHVGPPTTDLDGNELIEEDSGATLNPMTSESENDEVEDPYNGYEQLPTDLVETNEESIEVTEDIQPTSSVFSEETAETIELANKSDPLPLDDSKIQTIKDFMSNFFIPPSCIPEWAAVVPEDQWKAELIARLNTKKPDA